MSISNGLHQFVVLSILCGCIESGAAGNKEPFAKFTRVECHNMNPNILKRVNHTIDNSTGTTLTVDFELSRDVHGPNALLTLMLPQNGGRLVEFQKFKIDLCNLMKSRNRKFLTLFTDVLRKALNLHCPFRKDVLYRFNEMQFRSGVLGLFGSQYKFATIFDVFNGQQEQYLRLEIFGMICSNLATCK